MLAAVVGAPNWADIMTAFGTVGAVVIALGLAIRDQFERARRERCRQAELITGWWEHESATGVRATVKNASQECVYRVMASVVTLRGGNRTLSEPVTVIPHMKGEGLARIGLLRPGGEYVTLLEHRPGSMGLRFGVEFAFRDAGGRCWVRRASGKLEEIGEDPLYNYGQAEPTDWENG